MYGDAADQPQPRPKVLTAMRDWSQIRHQILGQMAVFAAYLVFFRISYIFLVSDLRSTPWNPETGLAVAAGALLGWPSVPVIALANFTARELVGAAFPSLWEAVASATSALVFAGSAAAFRNIFTSLKIPTTKAVVLFLGYATLATIISALARLAIVMFAFRMPASLLWQYTLTLSVGNLVGIIIVVPLLIFSTRLSELLGYFGSWSKYQWMFLVSIFLSSIVVFGIDGIDQFKFFYLTFMPVIAFAAKDGFLGAAFSIPVSNAAMIGILYLREFESSTATELQLLMISLSVTGLILGAAVSERYRMSLQLDESNARLRDSQNSLVQASRISLASEMAAALAHELNQPLTAIRNYVRSVRRNLDKPKTNSAGLKADIDLAVQQVDVAASLIHATRKFLQKGEIRFQQVDVNDLVATCFELVEPELRNSGVNWQVRIPGKLPFVRGNAVQIQQVILNLIRNAKESINEGKPRIKKIEFQASANTRPGYIEFTISDTGPGLPAEIKTMLFKPLRSSKPLGLGLGLSLCNTIVTAHGGEIWLMESTPSQTKFAFTLPCST